ncbi:hypothetical protein GQ55_3G451800 [Panicum hallii var. hallii]|uniref:Uncharacterized protein n=1 Tax=Panicum hallii var. hallii TaxID=1504633 RepID=A0A2T7EII1_9POAL|nr:hypothetical protein GQ55_3G451800 [Panicum hallii var. hallii]
MVSPLIRSPNQFIQKMNSDALSEAPRPRRARRLLAGDRPPGHAVLEEPRRRPDRRRLLARRLLDRRRGRVDPEGVHERGVRLQRQPDDHPLRVVGALGGAALPLVRVLVAAQRLRAEELAQAEVAGEHLVRVRRRGRRRRGGGGGGLRAGGARRRRCRFRRLARAQLEVQPRRAVVVLLAGCSSWMVHQREFAVCFIKEDEVGGAWNFFGG